MMTIAEKINKGVVVRRYVLKQDEKGFYFDGLHYKSFRRKTRKGVEDDAARLHFDVYDTEQFQEEANHANEL